MNTYELKFSVERINCDKFKQKQIAIIRNIIEQGRLRVDMKFNSYGLIEFDKNDERHLFPIITETEEYNRLKTNCMIYDFYYTDINDGYYDKAFIYQTNGSKSNGWYGFILYNSKTGKHVHKYYIEREEDELCRQFAKSLNILRFKYKYVPYV